MPYTTECSAGIKANVECLQVKVGADVSLGTKVQQLAVAMDQLNIGLRTSYTGLCQQLMSAACNPDLQVKILSARTAATKPFNEYYAKVAELKSELEKAVRTTRGSLDADTRPGVAVEHTLRHVLRRPHLFRPSTACTMTKRYAYRRLASPSGLAPETSRSWPGGCIQCT